jgi:hypothetical protein
MNEREIQKAAILRWISEHGEIDALTALRELGIMRLASRICDLKKDGFPVVDRWEYKYDERGRVLKKWKVYSIAGRAAA